MKWNNAAILCTVHWTRMFIYMGYWTLKYILLIYIIIIILYIIHISWSSAYFSHSESKTWGQQREVISISTFTTLAMTHVTTKDYEREYRTLPTSKGRQQQHSQRQQPTSGGPIRSPKPFPQFIFRIRVSFSTLTHYSTKPQRPSDSSQPMPRLMLSGDVYPNPRSTTKYPSPVSEVVGWAICTIIVLVGYITAVFDTFQPLSCDMLASIIHKLKRTTCELDPFPTIIDVSVILYYQYYSTYCESLVLDWWFSSILQVGNHFPPD